MLQSNNKFTLKRSSHLNIENMNIQYIFPATHYFTLILFTQDWSVFNTSTKSCHRLGCEGGGGVILINLNICINKYPWDIKHT